MSAGNTKTLAQRLAEARAGNSPAPKIEQPVVTKAVEPPPREPSLFEQYAQYGLALVPIKDGEKRPTANAWNEQRNAIRDPERAKHLVNAGLLHAFSGTAVIDVDNVDASRSWLKDHGISFDDLVNAPDAVRIHSGDPGRGKLVYALPSTDNDLSDHAKRWPTKQISVDDAIIFELRCGASTGNSAQDVLPPSVNPRTKQRYEWIGDWRKLPPLPESLRTLWQSMVAPKMEQPERVASVENPDLGWVRELLDTQDPDCAEPEWWAHAARVVNATGGSDDGYEIFDAWSSKGTKYEGPEDTRKKWDEVCRRPPVDNPVTMGSLAQEQVATTEAFGPPLDQDVLAAIERDERAAKLAKYKPVMLRDFATREPVQYLVKDLIEVAQLFGLIGRRKGGKSYAALDLAFAVAQGRPWAHHAVLNPGPVVWIAAEGARSLKIRRSPQWLAHYGDADIRVWPHALNLRREDTYEGLLEMCRDARLVVIDSLRRVTPGAKENSSDELAEVLAYAEQLTLVTGAAVCFIAHAGKGKNEGDATTARGTSAIEDSFEAGFGVEKLEGDNAGKFKVTHLFARDEEADADAAMFFELCEITPEGIEPGVIVNWDVDAPASRKSAKPKAHDWLAFTDEVLTQLGGAGEFTRSDVHDAVKKLADERLDSFGEDAMKQGVNRALAARLNGKQRTIKATQTEKRAGKETVNAFALVPISGNPDRAQVDRLLAEAPVPEPTETTTDPDGDLI